MVISDAAMGVLTTEGLDDVQEFLVLASSHDVVQLHSFHTELYKPTRCLSEHELVLVRDDHTLLDQGHH